MKISYAIYILLTSVNLIMPENKLLIKEKAARIKAALLGKPIIKKAIPQQNKTSIVFDCSHENISLFNDALAPAKPLTIQFSQTEVNAFALTFIQSNKLRIKKVPAKKKTIKAAKTSKLTKTAPTKAISPVIGKFTKAIVRENPTKKDWYAHCNDELRNEYRLRFLQSKQEKPTKLKELKIKAVKIKLKTSSFNKGIDGFVAMLKSMFSSDRGR